MSAPAFAQDIDLGTFDTDDSEEEEDEKRNTEADDDILDLEDPDDDEWAVPLNAIDQEEDEEGGLDIDGDEYEEDFGPSVVRSRYSANFTGNTWKMFASFLPTKRPWLGSDT